MIATTNTHRRASSCLNQIIATAETTRRLLAVKRQLAETRAQRMAAARDFETNTLLPQQHRQEVAKLRFHRLVQINVRASTISDHPSNIFVAAVQQQQHLNTKKHGRYIVRTVARLIRVQRLHHVMVTHILPLIMEQNHRLVGVLHEYKQDVQVEVQTLREEQQERAHQIQQHMISIMTRRLSRYYKEKSNISGSTTPTKNNQRSLLQQLVVRKAKNRLVWCK